LRPIPLLTVEPTLPSPDYPIDSVYQNATTGQYRKNISGAWADVTESVAIAGKLEYSLLGTLKASSITGLITAAQIDHIDAAQITGTIEAGQIGTIDASSITNIAVGNLVQGGAGTGYLDRGLIAGGGFSDNLVLNGGFESGIAGWVTSLGGGTHAGNWGVVTSTTAARSGTKSLIHPAESGGGFAAVASTPLINVQAGAEMTLEAYLWASTAPAPSGSFVIIRLDWFDSSDTYLSDSRTTVLDTDIWGLGWVKKSVSGTVPAGASKARANFVLWNHQNGGEWRLEDVFLVRKIAGTQIQPLAINATHITSVNASAISGTITSSQIGTISASQITGTISSSQISTVSASQITGTISSSQISTISASQISGTLTATQIGTITASQIATINAATITIGLVQDGQIAAVNASKLTAGTITATVTMTSPIITGGSLNITASTGDVTSISSNGALVHQNGSPSSNISLSSTGIGGSSSGSSRFSLSRATGNGVLQLYSSSGSLYCQIDPSLGTTGGGSTAFAPNGYWRVIINGVARSVPYF
jgi:hypothetical protein